MYRIIFLALLLVRFCWDITLQILSGKQVGKPLPKSVEGIYDEAEYDKWRAYNGKKEAPCFLKGSFTASEKTDCYVKLDGFTKGFVTVNGRNLGRFWNIGPQFSLYLPGCWLNEGENEIIVFEQEGFEKPEIEITDVAAELL